MRFFWRYHRIWSNIINYHRKRFIMRYQGWPVRCGTIRSGNKSGLIYHNPLDPCMVYSPTFTIKINHSCRWIYCFPWILWVRVSYRKTSLHQLQSHHDSLCQTHVKWNDIRPNFKLSKMAFEAPKWIDVHLQETVYVFCEMFGCVNSQIKVFWDIPY